MHDQAIPLNRESSGQIGKSMVTVALQETVTLPLLSELELLAVISGVIDKYYCMASRGITQ